MLFENKDGERNTTELLRSPLEDVVPDEQRHDSRMEWIRK